MSIIKSPQEIDVLRQGGRILAGVLNKVVLQVNPGVTTAELNKLAESLILENGGRPAFKGYGEPPFPAGLCTSVNSEVVHGIPSEDVVLEMGDIISLDIGMEYPAENGLFTDMAVTVPVGKVSPEVKFLIQTTKKVLMVIHEMLRPGIDLQEISKAVQKMVESNGFGVVRDLVGHGVGHAVHEEPQIPNFVIPNYHLRVRAGMVLAFEPMVTMGDYKVRTKSDLWTVETKDKSLAAHFEHTFVVTESGNDILTKI